MTIGEKIKYFRTRVGITQGKLAQISKIHPVSIRKYETNKMVPQQAQIERIADALGVSSFVFTETHNNIKLETVGDFMGLFLMLFKAGIISISGERLENGALIPETVSFKINPFIARFFSATIGENICKSSEIDYYLTDKQIFSDILRWEKVNYHCVQNEVEYKDTGDRNILNFLEEMKNMKELIEVEFQRSRKRYNVDGSISVKIPPNYL